MSDTTTPPPPPDSTSSPTSFSTSPPADTTTPPPPGDPSGSDGPSSSDPGPGSSDSKPPPSGSGGTSGSITSPPASQSSSASSTSVLTESSTSISSSDVIITSGGSTFTSTQISTMVLPPGATVTPASSGGSTTKSNTGAIAGGVVGGVALLVILALLGAFLIRRHKKKKLEEHFDGNFDPAFVENTSHSGSNRRSRQMANAGGAATLPRIDLLEGEDEAGMVEPYSTQPSLHQQYTGSSSGKASSAGAFAGAGAAMGASGAAAMDPRQLHAYYNGTHSPPPPSTMSAYTQSTDPASANAHQTMFPQPQTYPLHQPHPQQAFQGYNPYNGQGMLQQQPYPISEGSEGQHLGAGSPAAGAAAVSGIAAKRMSKEREAMGQYHTTNPSPSPPTETGQMTNPHSAAGSPGVDAAAQRGGYFPGSSNEPQQQKRASGVLVHQDAGRVEEDDEPSTGGQKEIPPTYDSLVMDRKANRA